MEPTKSNVEKMLTGLKKWQAENTSKNNTMPTPMFDPGFEPNKRFVEAMSRVGAGCPKIFKHTVDLLRTHPLRPKLAIKVHCLACVGFEDARHRIKECDCYSCPLWALRPYQNYQQAKQGK